MNLLLKSHNSGEITSRPIVDGQPSGQGTCVRRQGNAGKVASKVKISRQRLHKRRRLQTRTAFTSGLIFAQD